MDNTRKQKTALALLFSIVFFALLLPVTLPQVDATEHRDGDVTRYPKTVYYWSLDNESLKGANASVTRNLSMGAREQFGKKIDYTYNYPPTRAAQWNNKNLEEFRANSLRYSTYPAKANVKEEGRLQDVYIEIHSVSPRVTVHKGSYGSTRFGRTANKSNYISRNATVNTLFDYRVYAPDKNADQPQPPFTDPDKQNETIIYRDVQYHGAEKLWMQYVNSRGNYINYSIRTDQQMGGLSLSPRTKYPTGIERHNFRVKARVKSNVRITEWNQVEWCETYGSPINNHGNNYGPTPQNDTWPNQNPWTTPEATSNCHDHDKQWYNQKSNPEGDNGCPYIGGCDKVIGTDEDRKYYNQKTTPSADSGCPYATGCDLVLGTDEDPKYYNQKTTPEIDDGCPYDYCALSTGKDIDPTYYNKKTTRMYYPNYQKEMPECPYKDCDKSTYKSVGKFFIIYKITYYDNTTSVENKNRCDLSNCKVLDDTDKDKTYYNYIQHRDRGDTTFNNPKLLTVGDVSTQDTDRTYYNDIQHRDIENVNFFREPKLLTIDGVSVLDTDRTYWDDIYRGEECYFDTCNYMRGHDHDQHWKMQWLYDRRWDNNSVVVNDTTEDPMEPYKLSANVKQAHFPDGSSQVYVNPSTTAETPIWGGFTLANGLKVSTQYKYYVVRKPEWDTIKRASPRGVDTIRTDAQGDPYRRWDEFSNIRPIEIHAYPAENATLVGKYGSYTQEGVVYTADVGDRGVPELPNNITVDIADGASYRAKSEIVVKARETQRITQTTRGGSWEYTWGEGWKRVGAETTTDGITINGIIPGVKGDVNNVEHVTVYNPQFKIERVSIDTDEKTAIYRVHVTNGDGDPVNTLGREQANISVTGYIVPTDDRQRELDGSLNNNPQNEDEVDLTKKRTIIYETGADGTFEFKVTDYTKDPSVLIRYQTNDKWWTPIDRPINDGGNIYEENRYQEKVTTLDVDPRYNGKATVLIRFLYWVGFPLSLGLLAFYFVDKATGVNLWPPWENFF